MANNPYQNDPHIIDGYEDGADLLGYDDGAGLMSYGALAPTIPGRFDTSDDPLGGRVGERVYLVTATLYPDWTNQSPATGDGSVMAIANHPIAGFPFGADLGAPVATELRLASQNFATLADDPDLPSAWFRGCVTDPGSISRSLPLTPVGAAAIDTSIGQVVLDNTNGAFDTIFDQTAAISQSITIRGGRIGIDIADFVTLFTGRVTGLGVDEETATLSLQDPVLYAQNLFPTSIYTGLGAADGDAELEGVVKPVVLGRVWNMSPVLINAASLIYQVHDGAIAAVTGVFDGGVALTGGTNYASYALLAAASLSGGQYATCLVEGMIRVGGTPAYALTAHVDGASAAGITTRSIAQWLIGQIETQLEVDVDDAGFAALPAWTAGWVWADAFTLAEAVSRFVGDAGYHWGADVDGTIRALQLDAPDAGAVVRTYRAADIMGLERAPLPQGYEGIHQRRQVLYQRNWTVQDDSALAATAATRAGRQREWRTAMATATITSRNAIDPAILETSIYAAAHAGALADHLIDLHGEARAMFWLSTEVFGTIPRIGETVRVAYPRFGLGDGDLFRVVAINLSLAEGGMKLLLWG